MLKIYCRSAVLSLQLQLALYASPSYLRHLQGDVIPTIIGVYLIDGLVSVAMELPHSSFWIEASPDMPDAIKEKCIDAYNSIHACGVLHNNVDLRHILISAEGRPVIIELQHGQALKPHTELGIAECTEDQLVLEKRKVKYKLDYKSARRTENDKRRQVFGRRKRNAQRYRKHQLKRIGEWNGNISDFEDDDPDDIDNPIVEAQVWMDCWVDDGFFPTCYIVPGQQIAKLQGSLSVFIQKWRLLELGNGASSILSSGQSTGSRKRKRSMSATASSSWSGFEKLLDDGQPDFPRRRRRLAYSEHTRTGIQKFAAWGEFSSHNVVLKTGLDDSNRQALLEPSYTESTDDYVLAAGSDKEATSSDGHDHTTSAHGFTRGTVSKRYTPSASHEKFTSPSEKVNDLGKSSERAAPSSSALKRPREADEAALNTNGPQKAKRAKHVRLSTAAFNDSPAEEYSTVELESNSSVPHGLSDSIIPSKSFLPTYQIIYPQSYIDHASSNTFVTPQPTIHASFEEGAATAATLHAQSTPQNTFTCNVSVDLQSRSVNSATDELPRFSNAPATIFNPKSLLSWWKKWLKN